ncbi:hypothetical protein EDC04DRAFT_1755335 [Pisolithus marmoratus]|nr:hypothetical protein EDC04DRAFT_1755335 [Pisolithus marmoratus]
MSSWGASLIFGKFLPTSATYVISYYRTANWYLSHPVHYYRGPEAHVPLPPPAPVDIQVRLQHAPWSLKSHGPQDGVHDCYSSVSTKTIQSFTADDFPHTSQCWAHHSTFVCRPLQQKLGTDTRQIVPTEGHGR